MNGVTGTARKTARTLRFALPGSVAGASPRSLGLADEVQPEAAPGGQGIAR